MILPTTGYYENDERLGKIPMYNRFLKIRKIKSVKKEHKCEFCEQPIYIGDSCENWVGIDQFDGKFFSHRVCNKCIEAK